MTTLFQNSRQVANYASFRPTYPKALFDRIAVAVTNPHQQAVADIGCGTGQATAPLAKLFAKVTGVDPSASQIQEAAKKEESHRNINFVVGEAQTLSFADQSLGCITVAQAAHWFDLEAFYAQVDRVLRPEGVLAIWCYGLPRFPRHSELQHLIHHGLYEETLGAYWDERRRIVEHMYKDLKTIDQYYHHYQTESIEDFRIEKEATNTEIIGYLRSWSAYSKYCEQHSVVEGSEDDPLHPIETWLSSRDCSTIPMVSPLRLLLSKKQPA